MDPPAEPPQRRTIPRPWLEKQRRQAYTVAPSPHKQSQLQSQSQMLISPMSFEVSTEGPIILLEKPSPLKSFFKMNWCCRNSKKEHESLETRPSFGIAVQQVYHTTVAAAPLEMIYQHQHHHIDQQQHQQHSTSPSAAAATGHLGASFDDSSFRLAPRPTVIYIVQGNASTIGGEGLGNIDSSGHNWHQSYLSMAEDSPAQPRTVQQRNSSFDTSMTSLSVDDSLAFSDDFPPPQRHFSEDDQERRRSSIPRPPRMSSKSKTTGTALLTSSHTNTSKRPPMAPPRPLARSSTTGSATSPTGSRNPRLYQKLDRDLLQRLKSDETDYDNASTIATDGGSPLFPLLSSSSPRSQDSERKEKELYMPKCAALEMVPPSKQSNTNDDMLLSGWVAYSMGDSLLHKRKLARKHLAYLVVYENDATCIHLLQQPPTDGGSGERTREDQAASTRLTLPLSTYDRSLSVQTVECQGGRSVVIKQTTSSGHNSNIDKILFTMLPINLPASQFDAEDGTVKRNLTLATPSVAQHDAALYLWFGLDGWMRRRQ